MVVRVSFQSKVMSYDKSNKWLLLRAFTITFSPKIAIYPVILITTSPPISPVNFTAKGMPKAPAPIEELVSVKIEPRTDPGFIELNVR